MKHKGMFEVGKQPCQNFKEQETYYGLQTHDCYGSTPPNDPCKLSVSFCLNCHTDHHENGYETCARFTNPVER